MNICFFSFLPMVPYEGGVQRVTTVLSHGLSERGHGIVFLFYSVERKHKLNDPSIEFPQFYLDITSKDDDVIRRDFRAFLDKYRIDVIINQEPELQSCRLLLMVKDLVGVISVSHVVPFAVCNYTREKVLREFPATSIRMACIKAIAMISPGFYIRHSIEKTRSLFHQVLHCSDRFVFVSDRFFPRILQYMPDFPLEKMDAINNPSTFSADQSFDYDRKRNVVLWVGRVDKNKNCLDFLKAWIIFSRRHPNWSAIVAGDGPELQRCKRWANKNKINNLSFLGYCEKVERLYVEAKVFVSTSFRESWGMSLVEALSMGCVPCVYNTYETLSDIIQDGVNGLLCTSSPRDVAEKMALLASDDALTQRMAIEGRVSISGFSVSSVCDKWSILLNEVIKTTNE